MGKATGKYVLFIALAVICFQWKTLLTNQYTNLVGSEGVNQTYAWLHFWLRSVHNFALPLWDPYVFAGRPFAGETQTTAYYPFRLFFALFPWNRNGLVSPHLYHDYLALIRFSGACFMFAFLRELRHNRFAAFIGASAFSMGGLLGRLPWPMHMEACTWLPASLFFIARSLRPSQSDQRTLMEASLAGLCLGLSILTGGIQFAMMSGIGAVLTILYLGLSQDYAINPRAAVRRVAIVLGAYAVVGVGVGGPQLIPSLEYGHHALRFIKGGWFPMSKKIPYDRMDGGANPQSLLTGLFPVGGGPTGGEFWPYYVGALPFFLAIWAIWRCIKAPWVRVFIGLAVFAFFYALGEFSPLAGLLYATVPYLWTNREPTRFLFLTSFSLAGLASFGLDNLLRRGSDTAIWPTALPLLKWITIVAAVLMVLPGIVTQITMGAWTYLSLIFVVTCCGSLVYLIRQSPTSSARLLLAAFVLLDLGGFNWNVAGSQQIAESGNQYEQMITLKAPADFIKSQPGLGRVRVNVSPEPNIGDVYDVQSMWGGGVTILENYSRLSQRESLLNLLYRIKPASTPDPGAIYQDSHWKVYKENTAFPRAWMVHKTVVVPSDDDVFVEADRQHLDLHNVGVMAAPLSQTLDPVDSGDTVHFSSYSANSMSVDVNAAGRGLLVLSEIFYPGWTAQVNGRTVDIYKVDGGLRGIPVTRGESRVVLTYAPTAEYVSAVIAVLLMLICCWFGFQIWRTRSMDATPTD